MIQYCGGHAEFPILGLLQVESSVRSIGIKAGLGFAACILAKWLASNEVMLIRGSRVQTV
jgi:hypothetical protein